jgi:DUF1365 family protein
MKSQIFIGTVFHKRFRPKVHEFTYSGYFLKISLNEIDQIKNALFSVNKFNLFSFYFKDHGFRDGSDLISFAKNILKKENVELDFDDIVIHTMPRLLGFVFNPVSFWYLYKDGEIKNIIAEVNNTFGETHSYLLTPDKLEGLKLMQVSPFNQIIGNYQFKFSHTSNHEQVIINYFNEDKPVVHALVEGSPHDWKPSNFLKLFFKNPIANLAVVFFIHLQALKLFIKGVPFYGKNGVVS